MPTAQEMKAERRAAVSKLRNVKSKLQRLLKRIDKLLGKGSGEPPGGIDPMAAASDVVAEAQRIVDEHT